MVQRLVPTASGPWAVPLAVPRALVTMPWICDAAATVRSFASLVFPPQTDLSGSHLSKKQDDPLLIYLGPHVRVRR